MKGAGPGDCKKRWQLSVNQGPGAASLEALGGAVWKDHPAFAAEMNETNFFDDAEIDDDAFVADNDGRGSQRAFFSLGIECNNGAVSGRSTFRPAGKVLVGEGAPRPAADTLVIQARSAPESPCHLALFFRAIVRKRTPLPSSANVPLLSERVERNDYIRYGGAGGDGLELF